jgi:hypothetical protein
MGTSFICLCGLRGFCLIGWVLWLIIPGTWEAKIKTIEAQGKSGQKVFETPSPPMAGDGGTHLSSQLHWEAQIGASQSRQPGHKS